MDRVDRGLCLLLVAVAVGGTAGAVPGAPAAGDEYIRGYAEATLRDAFDLSEFGLEVRHASIRVVLHDAQGIQADTLARALVAIDGVERVELRDAAGALLAEVTASDSETVRSEWDLFPPDELFSPLQADPRWPHFSASYQRYWSSDDLDHAVDVSFGETFSLVRRPAGVLGRVELGLHAGVFSVFDLAASSFDLVNSDFLVGLDLAQRSGPLSSTLRFYHQSSHLGDEFLLRNSVERVNLSFEVLDALLSWEPFSWLRLYGGGGLMVHREPKDLDRWLTQMGVEIESGRDLLKGYLKPLAAADLQLREESDWRPDLSVRAGFQLQHPRLRRLEIRLLASYYRGRSPNGQFYSRRIETAGVGVHLGL